MTLLQVGTLGRRVSLGGATGRWRTETLGGSCIQESSKARGVRRSQRSRLERGRWGWRGRYLTAEVSTTLFRLFPLLPAQCGISTIRGTWRGTEKKRNVVEYERCNRMCSLALQRHCRDEILESTNYQKWLFSETKSFAKSSLRIMMKISCSRKNRTHLYSKNVEEKAKRQSTLPIKSRDAMMYNLY